MKKKPTGRVKIEYNGEFVADAQDFDVVEGNPMDGVLERIYEGLSVEMEAEITEVRSEGLDAIYGGPALGFRGPSLPEGN